MNVFILDEDKKICAQYHPVQHCGKMILESCQLMSAAHRMIDGELVEGVNPNGRKRKEYKLTDPKMDEVIYAASHTGHPCTLYTKETTDNYLYIWEHTKALADEFTYRTGKVHKSWSDLGQVLSNPPRGLTKTGLTEPPQCMPDEYKVKGNQYKATETTLMPRNKYCRTVLPIGDAGLFQNGFKEELRRKKIQ